MDMQTNIPSYIPTMCIEYTLDIVVYAGEVVVDGS
jgi:hypothetical protein